MTACVPAGACYGICHAGDVNPFTVTVRSRQRHAVATATIATYPGVGGWTVHGKTGSGRLDKSYPFGWFVGWAEKAGREVVFARLVAGEPLVGGGPGGVRAREDMTLGLDALLRGD